MRIHKFITLSALAGTMLVAQQPSNSPQSGQTNDRSGAQSGQTSSSQSTSDRANTQSGQTGQAGRSGTSSSSPTAAGSTAQSGESASMLGKQDQTFLMEAARGGMMEVQVAQMAQQKAASDEVKQYARTLEQDHTKAGEKLKAIAQERGVQMPSDLGKHQAVVSQLNGLSGEEFDRAFMKMQVQHHKKDVKDFRKQSNNSMDTDLREFASSTLPTLEQHLRQAETLASQSGSRSRKQQ